MVSFFFFCWYAYHGYFFFFFFQAEDGIRDKLVTGVQTCALPLSKNSLWFVVRAHRHKVRLRPNRNESRNTCELNIQTITLGTNRHYQRQELGLEQLNRNFSRSLRKGAAPRGFHDHRGAERRNDHGPNGAVQPWAPRRQTRGTPHPQRSVHELLLTGQPILHC